MRACGLKGQKDGAQGGGSESANDRNPGYEIPLRLAAFTLGCTLFGPSDLQLNNKALAKEPPTATEKLWSSTGTS